MIYYTTETVTDDLKNKPRIKLTFKAQTGDKEHTLTLIGQVARTLRSLVQAKDKGITALDVSSTWALRLAAYIHILRHKHGLPIITIPESHPGGYHARYVLNSNVELSSSES